MSVKTNYQSFVVSQHSYMISQLLRLFCPSKNALDAEQSHRGRWNKVTEMIYDGGYIY